MTSSGFFVETRSKLYLEMFGELGGVKRSDLDGELRTNNPALKIFV